MTSCQQSVNAEWSEKGDGEENILGHVLLAEETASHLTTTCCHTHDIDPTRTRTHTASWCILRITSAWWRPVDGAAGSCGTRTEWQLHAGFKDSFISDMFMTKTVVKPDHIHFQWMLGDTLQWTHKHRVHHHHHHNIQHHFVFIFCYLINKPWLCTFTCVQVSRPLWGRRGDRSWSGPHQHRLQPLKDDAHH